MELISRNELKEKLDRKDSFKLVMVLGEWAYRAKHIPGSLNVFAPELAKDMLDPEDDIIIYCSDENCPRQQVCLYDIDERRIPENATLRRWHRRLGGGRISNGRRDGKVRGGPM